MDKRYSSLKDNMTEKIYNEFNTLDNRVSDLISLITGKNTLIEKNISKQHLITSNLDYNLITYILYSIFVVEILYFLS